MRFLDVSLEQTFSPDYCETLDHTFLDRLKKENATLHDDLLIYRKNPNNLNPLQISELIIAASKVLEAFLIDYFDIEPAYGEAQAQTLKHQPVFAFKKWIVLRRAKRRLLRDETLPDFQALDAWLNAHIQPSNDKELAVADFAMRLLEDTEKNKSAIEKLTDWVLHILKNPEAHTEYQYWVSLKLPKKTDYKKLIPVIAVNDSPQTVCLKQEDLRQRDGFKLTDKRMNEREILSEIDYCVYCHDHDGDFCSKGFPEKKGEPEQGFRNNPLDNILTGCPLDEKISEMHLLKRDADTIAALATIMIDNPMCPATGHRICNDCMKACIYQKQDPVNIPQVETGVLSDVLKLPYGVELYDLLTRWNPLRADQPYAKAYNGKNVFIAGMGPAGFTLAHHLLMAGCGVVGSDGLKIEPLPEHLRTQAIKDFNHIKESLDDRVMAGFGGVAEYGITVRWDKNFLKLIYISLMRRPHFQVFDGVRFGGNATVEHLYHDLNFDHITIAVGAGLPRALPVPGSMARGMRQANDFLMALQLTGAAKENSLANLQLRMPVLVIGGGLTGVDAATEAQAYYIKQVEKTAARYHVLCANQGKDTVRTQFDEESLTILDEFLQHASEVKSEREKAAHNNCEPDFIKLLHRWGGVSIVYRRTMQASPAYISNHEELHKALEEGLFYIENASPLEVKTDEFGHVSGLLCEDLDGQFTLKAKSILVATGASPNVAYDFEHQNLFKRTKMQYDTFDVQDNTLKAIQTGKHVKVETFGPYTSYDINGKLVSMIGDVHPVFHGNVVRAIASAKRSYPKILDQLARQEHTNKNYAQFADTIRSHFEVRIDSVTRKSDRLIELNIIAPAAVKAFKPGQFYRLQTYERNASIVNNTLLQTEPLALLGAGINRDKNILKLLVVEKGASARLCAHLQPGEKVSLMGPTGVRSKIPTDKHTILIIANDVGIAYALGVAPALKAAGNSVNLLCYEKEIPYQKALQAVCNLITCTEKTIFDTLTHTPTLLQSADRITIFGDACLLKNFQAARQHQWANLLKPTAKLFGSVHSNMQCMMKGVCAQCLQWQVDPKTGKRTKAVFACSWQDQPLELIDFDNYADRVLQNKVSETLTDLWLSEILRGTDHERTT